MKKILAVLLCAVLSLGLVTGCAKKGPREEGATVVKVYARMPAEFTDAERRFMSDLFESFNDILDDGVEVDYEFVEDSDFTTKMTSARESGKAPDLYMAAYNQIYTEVTQGNIQPLDGAVSEAALADIDENVIEAVRFDGKTYAYPWFVEPSSCFFYNKKLLKQYGGDTMKVPETWEQAVAAGRLIQPKLAGKPNHYAIGLPTGEGDAWGNWGATYNALGSWPLNEDWTECILYDDADAGISGKTDIMELWQYYNTLYNDVKCSPRTDVASTYRMVADALADEKLVMTTGGAWTLAILARDCPDLSSNIGVTHIPTRDGDGTKATSTNGGWTWVMDAKSDKQAACAKFLDYAFSGTDLSRLKTFFGDVSFYSRVPARTSLRAQISEEQADNEVWKGINEIASHAVLEPLYPFEITAYLTAPLAVVRGGKLATDYEIEASVAEAKANIDNYLNTYRPQRPKL